MIVMRELFQKKKFLEVAWNVKNVGQHFADGRKEEKWYIGVQLEWKSGETHVRNHRLLRRKGLKRSWDRESAGRVR